MHKADKEHYRRIWQDLLDSGNIKRHIDTHLKERKPLIDCMLKHMENKARPIKILEVGCGTAIDSYNLINSVHKIEIYAVDYSWESLALAKKIGGCFPKPVRLLLNDGLRMAFKDEAFDIVFSQGLIEHFRDPAPIIREQMRVLRNDGLLIIDVPQKYNPYTVHKHRSISRGTWPWGWETEYSYFGLKRLGGRLGLTAVDRCGHGSSAFFGLAYSRFWPRGIRNRVHISGGRLLNKLLRLTDRFFLRLGRRWGHLYMQSVGVIFSKKRPAASPGMRLCMITGSFYPLHCGIGDYALFLSRELARQGYDLSVITGVVKGQTQRCAIDGIGVLRAMKTWGLSELFKLLYLVRQNSPDIVNIQYTASIYNNHIMINLLPFFIKRFIPGTKVVITFHEIIGPGIFWKPWFYLSLKFSDRIITTNNKYRDFLLKSNPWCEDKIAIVSVGAYIEKMHKLTAKERSSLRQGFGVDDDTALVASFGLMFPDRELEVLVKAARSIIDEGKKIKLIFIGGGSDIFRDISARYKDEVDRQIKDLSMENFVIPAGFVDGDSLSKIIQSADMAVLLYRYGVHAGRGSFMTVLSCGLPIITTAGDTVIEGLVDRGNILLLKDNDEKQLKSCMLELIDDQQLHDKLSSGARELSQRYSWDVVAERIVEAYGSLRKSACLKKVENPV